LHLQSLWQKRNSTTKYKSETINNPTIVAVFCAILVLTKNALVVSAKIKPERNKSALQTLSIGFQSVYKAWTVTSVK
jgi:hypothetical protein